MIGSHANPAFDRATSLARYLRANMALASGSSVALQSAADRSRLIAWGRALSLGVTVVLGLWAARLALTVGQGVAARGELGYDAALYAGLGRRFLDTGVMYSPVQLAGIYPAEGVVNLYPPLAMYLFAPFAVLPLILWWAIPLSILGAQLWTCRPQWWTWPLLVLILGLVPAQAAVFYGNTILWTAAAVALGFRFPVAAALVVFKPTDLLAVVVFVRRRAFWVGLALVSLAALPLWPHWFVWMDAIGNIEGGSPLRNINGMLVLAFPIIVWVGRRRKSFS